MAFKVDNNGNITMIQGDSGSLIIDGLNTDKNYTVYLAIQDKNRNTVGNELNVLSNYSSTVIFYLTGNYTDLLVVPKNKDFETYYYGIKICDTTENSEDTLILGNGNIGDLNIITVFPKKVEGENYD